jgi:histidine-specific SAM-dependent methyltransferase
MSVNVTRQTRNRAPQNLPIEDRVRDRRVDNAALERRALVAGLLATPASIAPKYFYDARGCTLFGEICTLPEYYPTRTEAAIFDRYREEIAGAIGTGNEFVDLGAGDCAKGAQWLPLVAPWRYVGVDIAPDALVPAVDRLAAMHPAIEVQGVLTDFAHGLDLSHDLAGGPVTFFYAGSSIGNFTPLEASRLLQAIRRHCRADGSGLLIGVDTKKRPASASTPRTPTSTRRRNSRRCSSAPAFRRSAAGRTTRATSPCTTARDRGRGARLRIASAHPAERSCGTSSARARAASRAIRRAARTGRT